jgi:hypothetical protein
MEDPWAMQAIGLGSFSLEWLKPPSVFGSVRTLTAHGFVLQSKMMKRKTLTRNAVEEMIAAAKTPDDARRNAADFVLTELEVSLQFAKMAVRDEITKSPKAREHLSVAQRCLKNIRDFEPRANLTERQKRKLAKDVKRLEALLGK